MKSKTKTKTISRTKLLQEIRKLKHRIFTVSWFKKNGERRRANARTGVYNFRKGLKESPSSVKHSILTVYLMWVMEGNTFKAEKGYRSLNLETINWIRMNGEHYEVHPKPILKLKPEWNDTNAKGTPRIITKT